MIAPATRATSDRDVDSLWRELMVATRSGADPRLGYWVAPPRVVVALLRAVLPAPVFRVRRLSGERRSTVLTLELLDRAVSRAFVVAEW